MIKKVFCPELRKNKGHLHGWHSQMLLHQKSALVGADYSSLDFGLRSPPRAATGVAAPPSLTLMVPFGPDNNKAQPETNCQPTVNQRKNHSKTYEFISS